MKGLGCGRRFVCLLFVYIWCSTSADVLTNLEKHALMVVGSGTSSMFNNNVTRCTTNGTTTGICTKRSQCNVVAPKIDPTTTFIKRESDGSNAITAISSTNCGWLQLCCPLEKVCNETPKAKIQKPQGCGFSHPGGNFRQSEEPYDYADFGEFPWMIALLKKKMNGKNFNDVYIGGGALIHPSVVVTAAHKVEDLDSPNELKCRAGEWDTASDHESLDHQERDVTDIVIHNQFDSFHVYYNVALLILKSPFDLNNAPHIGVACLELRMPPPETVCYSMGWGQDFRKGVNYANVLKKIKLKLVDAEKCQNQYRNTRLGRTYVLHRSLTCAGGEADVDTCIGDGGSPLVCAIPSQNNVRYAVVGLVAYGLDKCGIDQLPGVYVKIPEVYDWVITEMTLKHFNSSTFIY